MKLSYFSNQTVPRSAAGNRSSSKVPKVFFTKAGLIQFNIMAAELIDLEPGDQVTLAQDEDSPRDWYFFKDDVHGFVLGLTNNKKYLKFSHSSLINVFFNAFGLERISRNYHVQKEPVVMKGSKTQYWKILITD